MVQKQEMIDRITVNEQSSIRIGAEGGAVYFDPLHIGGAPHDAGVILITHAHFDHFSPEDVGKVSGDRTILVYPASMQDMIDGLSWDPARLRPMRAGETAEIGGMTVEAVPAYNRLKPFHPKSNGWLGYIVTIDGVRVYAAGDTDATREAEAVVCDIALWPIGGIYTTSAQDAAKLADKLAGNNPDVCIIPIHYGTIVGGPGAFDDFAGRVTRAVVVGKLTFDRDADGTFI